MGTHFRTIFKSFLIISGIAFLVLLAGIYVAAGFSFLAPSVAYFLSFLFVGSNFLAIRKFNSDEESRFYKRFFVSLAVRFVLIVAALIIILKTIKIHQIYFTVSFIISYIFHSVIEIIFINKILETDN